LLLQQGKSLGTFLRRSVESDFQFWVVSFRLVAQCETSTYDRKSYFHIKPYLASGVQVRPGRTRYWPEYFRRQQIL